MFYYIVDTHWHLKIQCLVCLHALHNRIVQVINIRLHELSQTLVPKLLLAIYRYSMAGVDHIFLITSPGQGCSRTCHHQSDSTTDTCNRRHSTFQFCMCMAHSKLRIAAHNTSLMLTGQAKMILSITGRIWKFPKVGRISKKFCPRSFPDLIFLQYITICHFSFVTASPSVKCH